MTALNSKVESNVSKAIKFEKTEMKAKKLSQVGKKPVKRLDNVHKSNNKADKKNKVSKKNKANKKKEADKMNTDDKIDKAEKDTTVSVEKNNKKRKAEDIADQDTDVSAKNTHKKHKAGKKGKAGKKNSTGKEDSASMEDDSEGKKAAGDAESKEAAADAKSKKAAGDAKGKKAAGDAKGTKVAGDVKGKKVARDAKGKKAAGNAKSKKVAGNAKSKKAAGNTKSKKAAGDAEGKAADATKKVERKPRSQEKLAKRAKTDKRKDEALQFLLRWKNNRSEWKYNRKLQVFLVTRCLNHFLLPEEHLSTFLEYIPSIEGGMTIWLRSICESKQKEYKEKKAQGTEVTSELKSQAKRAKLVLSSIKE